MLQYRHPPTDNGTSKHDISWSADCPQDKGSLWNLTRCLGLYSSSLSACFRHCERVLHTADSMGPLWNHTRNQLFVSAKCSANKANCGQRTEAAFSVRVQRQKQPLSEAIRPPSARSLHFVAPADRQFPPLEPLDQSILRQYIYRNLQQKLWATQAHWWRISAVQAFGEDTAGQRDCDKMAAKIMTLRFWSAEDFAKVDLNLKPPHSGT